MLCHFLHHQSKAQIQIICCILDGFVQPVNQDCIQWIIKLSWMSNTNRLHLYILQRILRKRSKAIIRHFFIYCLIMNLSQSIVKIALHLFMCCLLVVFFETQHAGIFQQFRLFIKHLRVHSF